MSSKRKREYIENLDRCYKVVQQSRTGINAVDVGKKINKHRATVHTYLNSLELMEKVYSEHGLWYPKETSVKKPSKESENFEFYIKHGLITKEEIDTYVAAQTFLKILPKNSQEALITKLLIGHFEQKIESLARARLWRDSLTEIVNGPISKSGLRELTLIYRPSNHQLEVGHVPSRPSWAQCP